MPVTRADVCVPARARAPLAATSEKRTTASTARTTVRLRPVTFGPEVIGTLEEPLSLVLDHDGRGLDDRNNVVAWLDPEFLDGVRCNDRGEHGRLGDHHLYLGHQTLDPHAADDATEAIASAHLVLGVSATTQPLYLFRGDDPPVT